MSKRLITGVFLIILLVPMLIFYDTVALPIVFAIISVIAMYETAACVKFLQGNTVVTTAVLCLLSAVIPFLLYFLNSVAIWLGAFFITAALAVFLLYAACVFHIKKRPLLPFYQLLTMFLYIAGASSAAVLAPKMGEGGYVLPLIFIGSWITDTFAYLTGRIFGKHKLIPSVSPKKTIEGSIGGIVFAVIFFIIYGAIVGAVADEVTRVNYAALFITALVISVVAQIGDLNASYIKRRYGIKDFGKMFPGHGGMLDRFDSVLATAPFLYVFALIFEYFR